MRGVFFTALFLFIRNFTETRRKLNSWKLLKTFDFFQKECGSTTVVRVKCPCLWVKLQNLAAWLTYLFVLFYTDYFVCQIHFGSRTYICVLCVFNLPSHPQPWDFVNTSSDVFRIRPQRWLLNHMAVFYDQFFSGNPQEISFLGYRNDSKDWNPWFRLGPCLF